MPVSSALFQQIAYKLVNQVFKDVSIPVTIVRPIYNNYDVESGSLVTAYEEYPILAVFGPSKNNNLWAQTSDNIQTATSQILFANITLPITPQIGVDTVKTPDNKVWEVIDVVIDEASASTIVKLNEIFEP